MGKERWMVEVRGLLRRALETRFEGDLQVKKAKAQAYADGYMRALMDADLVDRDQLLRLVGEERRGIEQSSVQS
jgi:hypothetical protein